MGGSVVHHSFTERREWWQVQENVSWHYGNWKDIYFTHSFFFFCHCSLFSRFELVLATLLLKLFSRGCFGRRHQIHVCSLQWLQERGISWMRVLADVKAFLHWDISYSQTWRTRQGLYAWRRERQSRAKTKSVVTLMMLSRVFFFLPNGAANREGEQRTVISAEVKHWPSQTWCKTHTWYVVWACGGWVVVSTN